MKKIFLFILSSLCYTLVFSQHKHKPVFNSYTSGGVQLGQSDPSLMAETVNGARFGNWFAGLGTGYSSYRYRTIPVFVDGRYCFGRKQQFFICGDIGYNINVHANYEEDLFYAGVKYKGGIYLNSGFGYVLQPSKKHSFYFQLDYGKKQVSKVANEFIWIDFPPYNRSYDNYTTYKYDLKTVAIKIGFKF
jgi:hypothetical protein